MRIIEFKKNALLPVLFFAFLFSFVNNALSLENDVAYNFKNDFIAIGEDAGSSGYEVDERIPDVKTRHSILKVFMFDILAPGYGHFYFKNYYWGFTFIALKLLCAYSFYYSYKELGDKRSTYYDSKRVYNACYNEFPLWRRLSDETVQNHKRVYDRAQQHVTFAILGNISVYLSSLILSYMNLKKLNENSIPTFELKYTFNKVSSKKGGDILILFNLRV